MSRFPTVESEMRELIRSGCHRSIELLNKNFEVDYLKVFYELSSPIEIMYFNKYIISKYEIKLVEEEYFDEPSYFIEIIRIKTMINQNFVISLL